MPAAIFAIFQRVCEFSLRVAKQRWGVRRSRFLVSWNRRFEDRLPAKFPPHSAFVFDALRCRIHRPNRVMPMYQFNDHHNRTTLRGSYGNRSGDHLVGWTHKQPRNIAAEPAAAAAPTVFDCRWIDAPIKIDGKADEPAWKTAQVIDNFSSPGWARTRDLHARPPEPVCCGIASGSTSLRKWMTPICTPT